MTRRMLAAFGMILAVLVIGVGPASASEPSITVAPSTGLTTGQTITISGSGLVPEPGNTVGYYQGPPNNFECVEIQGELACPMVDLIVVTVCDEQWSTEPNVFDGLINYCGSNTFENPVVATDGTFTAELGVSRQLLTYAGGEISCTDNCVVLALAWELTPVGTNSSGETVYTVARVITATVPITFAYPPPHKAACLKGGFRNYTTASGVAFKNQGQCVRYVESPKRDR